MKIHFNSIQQEGDKYVYEYHTEKKVNFNSTLGYFAIAGIIGSFKVVGEKGWLYLIPFWIIVIILSKILDWLIPKWLDRNKSIKIMFISNYPHYVLDDILWMLKNTDQYYLLGEIIANATKIPGKTIDIEIGSISAIEIDAVNFSKETLRQAVKRQSSLEKEWSSRTGIEYPDLGFPK